MGTLHFKISPTIYIYMRESERDRQIDRQTETDRYRERGTEIERSHSSE